MPVGVLAAATAGRVPLLPPGAPLFWFDVTDYALGDVLATWQGKGEIGLLASAQGATPPVVTSDGPYGKRAARFVGAASWMQTPAVGVATVQPVKLVAVCRVDSAAADNSFVASSSTLGVTLRTASAGSYQPFAGISVNGGVVVSNQWDAVTFTASGGASTLNQNGTNIALGNAGPNGLPSTLGVRLGANSAAAPSVFLTGYLAEAFAYGPGAPSDAAILAYLVRKWGAFPS